jgi:ACS family tartrate transporter-like MFS transporter
MARLALAPVAEGSSALDRARRKAFLHLIPICFVCYVLSYVDRTNVSLAKLTMKADLPWLTDKVFGDGAGLFFPGYVLLGVPGALLVEKWSARRQVTVSMVSWGIVASAMAFIETPVQFFTLRFLLGLTEAAFFPGMLVYLTHWFSIRDRARATASLLVATPFAQLSSPISGALLKVAWWGLRGWQWMFIVWGLPAIALGFIVFFGLADRPRHARWLRDDEREALERELERERLASGNELRANVLQALTHPKVLLLALAYFMSVSANYGIDFFLPSILRSWYKLEIGAITWVLMLPPVAAFFGQLLAGWHSDLKRERRLHTVVPLAFAAAMLFAASVSQRHLPLTVAFFVAAAAGIKGYQPAFWALPPLLLSETAAAGSIGLINAIGNLGGAFGPSMMGRIQSATGSYAGGLGVLAVSLLLSAVVVFSLRIGRG